MKGNNKFIFNEATMIEVVQAWLNANMLGNVPTITSVCYSNDVKNSFEISVKSEEK